MSRLLRPERLGVLSLVLLLGCATADERAARHDIDTVLEEHYGLPADTAVLPPVAEAELPAAPGLTDLLAHLGERNPGVRAAFHDWRAELEAAGYARRLPDPMLRYGWFAETIETRTGPMRQRIELSQTIPWFGTTGLRGDVQVEAARMAETRWRAAALRAEESLRTHWAERAFLERSIAVTEASGSLLERVEASARRRYAAGEAPQSSVLRAQVELEKLREDLRSLRAQRAPLAARVNALVNRAPTAPLAEATDFGPTPEIAGTEALRAAVLGANPELAGYVHRAAREENRRALTGKDRLPDLTLAVEYTDIGEARMAGVPDSGKDAWMLKGAVSVPLWVGSYASGERSATLRREAVLDEARSREGELLASLETTLYQLDEARRRESLYSTSLLPRARQSVAVLERAFAAGEASFLDLLDAQRTQLEFERQRERARADIAARIATVDRLTGTSRVPAMEVQP
jgi:outer membrane protein TolC